MGADQTKLSPDMAEKCTLPPAAMKKLTKAFRKAATKGPSIWRQDFHLVMKAIPPELRGGSIVFDHADLLFDMLDVNHSGTVDLEELLMGLSILTTGTMEEKAKCDVNRLLKDTFQAMDMDKSGSLDKQELQKQLEKLYKMMLTVVSGKIRFIIFAKYGNYVHDNVLRPAMETALASVKKGLIEDCPQELLSQGDMDGDGLLSMEEWLDLVKKNESAQWLVQPDPYIKHMLEDFVPRMEAQMPKPQ